MKVSQLKIENFRGIKSASLLFSNHSVLIGDNNIGKTTILEALDLALGPDRLKRFPPIDEHDFYNGIYLIKSEAGQEEDNFINDLSTPNINIEVIISELTQEQRIRFGDYIEFWDVGKSELYEEVENKKIDSESIVPAIRVTFIGEYLVDEDDFEGKTYFTRTLNLEGQKPKAFSKLDKQRCGFLYLRTLRTGSRAISLERGSLLDIILRLKELRPQMWEDSISNLSNFSIAEDEGHGITGILEVVNSALQKYIPKEWGEKPHLKVTNLTREHLRKVITPFISTGNENHSAPFYRQGTGTVNMMVLALLSIIAEEKQNVIFAMEEPEISIPPYAQKRIISELKSLSSQAIFTSHSPYVLEEFSIDDCIVLSKHAEGLLEQKNITLPNSVKIKRYRQEFRTRFCEGLLSRRILLAEGATEADSLTSAARRLSEINPEKYMSLEALGVCTIDSGSETQISELALLYKGLGKTVFGACDKQSQESKSKMESNLDHLFMHDEKGFEDLVLKNTSAKNLKQYANKHIDWPPHILKKHPKPEDKIKKSMKMYFKWSKGNKGTADYLAYCKEDDIPDWIKTFCLSMKELCNKSKKNEDKPNDT